MKKVLVLLVMVLAFGLSSAQAIQEEVQDSVVQEQKWVSDFPYGEVERLVGKRIKGDTLSESLQPYGFKGLFTKSTMKRDQIFEDNGKYASKYESVSEKIFKVISVTPYINIIKIKKFRIELLTEDGKTIFYNYDEKYINSFEFLIEGGFKVSDEYFCSKYVSKSYDEFDEETTYRSTIDDGFTLIRVNNSYYLSITAPANTTGAIGEKGVQLILKDGTKLSWNEVDLDTKVNRSKYKLADYNVSAFISLSEKELNHLLKSNPKKAKLYIFKRGFGSSNYKRAFDCIKNK